MAAAMKLGGEPLLFDQGSPIAEYLRKYQPLEDILIQAESVHRANGRMEARGISDVNLPYPTYADPPPARLNEMYWPTGASRWARGYFLCDQTALGAINTAINDQSQSLTLSVSNELGSLTTDVYLLSPRLIGGGPSPAYILPVVDERYWWQYKSIGDFGKPQVSTWAALLIQLESSLGITLTYPTVPAAYLDADPDEFTRRYDNAAVILDAVALSVGMRVVRDLDGTVSLLTPTQSDARVTTNRAGTADADWAVVNGGGPDIPHQVPASVDVVFPKSICKVPDCARGVYVSNVVAGVLKEASQTTVSAAKHSVHSTQWADYNISTDPDAANKADCDTLATQIATDYYGWLKSHRYDLTYSGLKTWLQGGQDDHILYSFGVERKGAILDRIDTMRIQPLPENFGPAQQLSNDIDIRVPEGLIAVKLQPGETLGALGNADCYQSIWSGSDWVADTNCTITVYDPFGWADFENEEEFWVRRGCDSGRFEVVNGPGGVGGGSGDTMVRLKAQACFQPGSSATFDLWQFSGGTWSDTMTDVTAHDSNTQVFLLPNEFCWAVKKEGTTRYELVPEQGLFRRVESQSGIGVGLKGHANVINHANGECDGQMTSCTVFVCNGGNESRGIGGGGHLASEIIAPPRTIMTGERFFARFVEGVWHAIVEPITQFLVESTNCKYPGDPALCSLFLRLDGIDSDWADTGRTVTVYDEPGYVMMLPGESHFATLHQGKFFFTSPYGLSRKGRAAGPIFCFEEGKVQIANHVNPEEGANNLPTCKGFPTQCVVDACNGNEQGFDFPTVIPNGAYVHIRFYEAKWHILPPNIPDILEATLDGALCGTDSRTPVSFESELHNCFDLPADVGNPLCLAGFDGDVVVLYRDVDDAGKISWNVLQVKHAVHTVHDLRWNSTTCAVERREHEITAMGCVDPGENWAAILRFQTTTQEFLYNWYVDEPNLAFRGEASKIYQPMIDPTADLSCTSPTCLWTHNGTIWVLTTPCTPGTCTCDTPTIAGVLDDTTTTSCYTQAILCTRTLVDKLLDTGEACPDAGA